MKSPKNIFLLAVFLIAVLPIFTSCLKNDDDDDSIDEVWKARNEKLFQDALATTEFEKLYTYSSGIPTVITPYILSKPYTGFFKNYDQSSAPLLRAVDKDRVEFTDSVYCRYEGWLITSDDEKYIFDSTENPTTGGTSKPNSVSRGFAVSGIVEGWRIALYNMKVGDEVQLVIPYNLGYGASGGTVIPGYTTLYFNMKLDKIVKMK